MWAHILGNIQRHMLRDSHTYQVGSSRMRLIHCIPDVLTTMICTYTRDSV